MSLESIAERLARGWRRTVAPAAMRLADEASVEGRATMRAASADTAVGDIQAATVRAAWIEQIGRLQGIHHRDRAQELLLAQLRRNVRDLDALQNERYPTPQSVGSRRMGLLGAVGGGGLFGAMTWFRPWMLWGGAFAALFGWGAVQSARLNHAKSDLAETRGALETVERQRDGWKERSEQLSGAVADARTLARAVAGDLEQERRRAATGRRIERERQREIQDLLSGSGDAPDWRLRDSEPPVS